MFQLKLKIDTIHDTENMKEAAIVIQNDTKTDLFGAHKMQVCFKKITLPFFLNRFPLWNMVMAEACLGGGLT